MGLLAVGLASALGAFLGFRQGIVRYRAAMLMGLAGMLTAPLGVLLAQHLPNRPLMGGSRWCSFTAPGACSSGLHSMMIIPMACPAR